MKTRLNYKKIVEGLCRNFECSPQELTQKAIRSLVMDNCFCDKPEDRLYHAADKTWWKRDKSGRLIGADSPIKSDLEDEETFWSAIGDRDSL